VFPPKRSQVQIQRGVGYVYLCRLYQSNCWAEGVPYPTNKGVSYTNLVWLGRDLKNRLLLLLLFNHVYHPPLIHTLFFFFTWGRKRREKLLIIFHTSFNCICAIPHLYFNLICPFHPSHALHFLMGQREKIFRLINPCSNLFSMPCYSMDQRRTFLLSSCLTFLHLPISYPTFLCLHLQHFLKEEGKETFIILPKNSPYKPPPFDMTSQYTSKENTMVQNGYEITSPLILV
jgi:hypothetical protein